MRNRLGLIGAALLISISAACSDDGSAEQASPRDAAPTAVVGAGDTQRPVQAAGGAVSAVGPGLSVADAIASTLEGPLLVNGFIFTKAGDVRLCSSLPREQYPTCGEPSIELSGLDPATVEGIEFLEGIGWTDEPTQVLGVKVDGVLTVSGTMLAQ